LLNTAASGVEVEATPNALARVGWARVGRESPTAR
jgi:hypothetical protein